MKKTYLFICGNIKYFIKLTFRLIDMFVNNYKRGYYNGKRKRTS